MILVNTEMPKNCNLCKFTHIVEHEDGSCTVKCNLKAYNKDVTDMDRSKDCPIIAEIPKETTNEDVIKSLSNDDIVSQIVAEFEEKTFDSPMMNPVFSYKEIMGILDKYKVGSYE